MDPGNYSSVTEFILTGLTGQPRLQLPLFLLFLGIYVVTVVGNLGMITLVGLSSHLHTPMYYFLSNLSLIDLCQSTVITPKMLMNFVTEKNIISYPECMTQLYFFLLFIISECYMLAEMAYDRYVAILCAILAMGTSFFGCIQAIFLTTLTFQLPYCGPSEVDYYFCDIPVMLKLACADTSALEMVGLISVGLMPLSCFLLILISYSCIVYSILQIRSTEGQRRAFSTCSAHLTAILLSFMPVVLIYLQPTPNPWLNATVQVLNNLVTPMLNPLIYSLRNKEVKYSLRKVLEEMALIHEK
uniref:Olfactory receptor n=1 Tax=Capra hircus TaxID=9925 RepID=A0A8C2PD21_CAPHI